MTDAREIIAGQIEPQAWAALGKGDTLAYKNRRTSADRKAIRIIQELAAAGFRILGPDEVDPVTLEKAAVLIERDEIDGSIRLDPKRHKNLSDWFNEQRAAAVRALGRKA